MWFFFLFFFQAVFACQLLPSTSLCATYLSYPVQDGLCIKTLESTIDTRTWSGLSSSCQSAVAQYECARLFAPCGSTSGWPPSELCSNVSQSCTKTLRHLPSSFAIAPVTSNSPLYGQNFSATFSTSDWDILFNLTWPGPNRLVCSTNATTTNGFPKVHLPKYARCEPYVGTECQGLLHGASVWVSATNTQMGLETAIQGHIRKILSWQERQSGCQMQLGQTLCARIFPRCDATTATRQLIQAGKIGSSWLGYPLPHPQFVSKPFCQEVYARCNNTLFVQMNLINCGSQTVVTDCNAHVLGAVPEWAQPTTQPANDLTSMSVLPGAMGVPLFYFPSNPLSLSTPALHIPCEYPHVESDAPVPGRTVRGQCVTGCVYPLFTVEEWNLLYQNVLGLAAGAGVLSFLFGASGWINARGKRHNKRNRFLYWFSLLFAFSNLMVLLMNAAAQTRTMTGKSLSALPKFAPFTCLSSLIDPVKQGDEGSGYCITQAFVHTYTRSARSMYLFFYVWSEYAYIRDPSKRRNHLWMHALAQVYGLVWAFVFLIRQEYEARADLFLCFTSMASPISSPHDWLNRSIEYLAYSFMFGIMYEYFMLRRALKTSAPGYGSGIRSAWKEEETVIQVSRKRDSAMEMTALETATTTTIRISPIQESPRSKSRSFFGQLWEVITMFPVMYSYLLTQFVFHLFLNQYRLQTSGDAFAKTMEANISWLVCFLTNSPADQCKLILPFSKASYVFVLYGYVFADALPAIFFGILGPLSKKIARVFHK